MKLRSAALTAIVLGCSLTALAQETARRDGQWEVTTQMSMAGMPNMPGMQASKSMQCVTVEEAADPAKTIPPSPQGRGTPKCTMNDYKLVGNKATFVMACEPPNAGKMTGEFVYAADTYTGTMLMEMSMGGQPVMMTMNYTGKRLGDCIKK